MNINITAVKVQFIITLIVCSSSYKLNCMQQRQGPTKEPTNILSVLRCYQQPPGLIIANSTTIFRPKAVKKTLTLATLGAHIPALKSSITLPSTRKSLFKTKEQKLYTAAKKGDLNSIKSLLQKRPSQFSPLEMIGLDIDAACTSDGRTALHVAAENNHKEIVDYLISQRANVDVRDQNYETPLYGAVTKGAINSIRSLILNNAKFDTTLIQHPKVRNNKKLTVSLKKRLKKNMKKDTSSRCAICLGTPKEMLKKHGGHHNYQITYCCANFICITDLINLLNRKKSSCPYCREQWDDDEEY